jgi:hypothetical protein
MQQGELEQKNLNTGQLTIGKGDTLQTRGIRWEVVMNRWHLINVIKDLKVGNKNPSYADIWPWVGTLLALVLAFVTSDFKNFIFPADTWRAVFIILAALSLWKCISTLLTAWRCRKERAKTPEQLVMEIEVQLANEQEKLRQQQDGN